MANTEPYELIAGPFEVYLAPVGTAFPDVDEAPSASWTRLGTSGSKNITEDGISATHEQTVERDAFRFLGTTGARKAVRTKEDFLIDFALADMTAEMYALSLNDAVVTDTPAGSGTPGTRSIPIHQGHEVAQHALLGRGFSPYGTGLSAQYQVPVCYQNGNPAPKYVKGAPALLAYQFVALEDPDANEGAEFGSLVIQDAVAL